MHAPTIPAPIRLNPYLQGLVYSSFENWSFSRLILFYDGCLHLVYQAMQQGEQRSIVLQRVLQCDSCMTCLYTLLEVSHHNTCPSLSILHSIIPKTSANTILKEVLGTDNTRELLHPAAEHQLCGRCKRLFARFDIADHILFCGTEQQRRPFIWSNRNVDSFPLREEDDPKKQIESVLHPYHLLAQFDPSILSPLLPLLITI